MDNRIRLFSTLLKIFFKLLYHQFAWAYDLVAEVVSLGMWKKWVLSVLPHLNGPKMLEIGHGPGHLLKAVCESGNTVVGVDESCQMGRIAKRRLKRSDITALLVNGYAQALPFLSDSYHQVVVTFPSEFIFYGQTLSEIYRVLTPGGTLFIILSARITGRHPLARISAWLFSVTGQSAHLMNNSFIQPVVYAGFTVRVEITRFESSERVLIHATKPLTHDN